MGSSGTGFNEISDEMIRDVVIDNNNNSYYLTKIFPQNPNIDGTPVTINQDSDLLLFSLDCQGNFRWSRTIGGNGDGDFAWKIAVDNNGGLYLFESSYNLAMNPPQLPTRFGDNDTAPYITTPYSPTSTVIDPGINNAFFLKYNTADGNLVWRKNLQGGVSWSARNSDISTWYMDSSKNIHLIIGFLAGTHLDGAVTVPSTFNTSIPNSYQYYLVKYNYDNGNMTIASNPILLPITGSLTPGLQGKVQMNYDVNLNRYYIAGSTSSTFQDYVSLNYNSTTLSNDGYVLAIDGSNGNEVWRREFTTYINNAPSNSPEEKIYSLLLDNAGNLYMSGRYFNSSSPLPTFSGGTYSYTLPVPDSGNQNFVMKLDSNGSVLWTKVPSTNDPAFAGNRSTRARIALNGNEIAFVKGSRSTEIWDSFTVSNAQNDLANSLLVRLNKDTGTAINVHPITSDYGSADELTSIAVDNDGNYVMGGYFSTQIFTDPNDGIPTISYSANNKSQFYVAKLAKGPCSPLSTTEISIKETDMQFYPNPVEDVLNIKTKESLKTYEVISAVGQQVKRGTFTAKDYIINMQGLTKGIYFVKVFTDKVSVVEKVVKK